VADLLGGLTSSGWLFLFAWVLPSSIFVSGVATLVLPALRDAIAPQATILASFAFVEQSLVLAFLALALGLVMGAASTPLYRLLEGYTWPARLRAWGTGRQRSRKELIASSVEEMEDGPEKALRYEQLQRFPGDPDIAPTRLGNALRAFETYGVDRYDLDSQSFWTELLTVVPDSLRTELARARANVDFFVATTYLSAAFGVLAVATGLAGGSAGAGLALLGIVALALSPCCYRLAVTSTTYWASTVRALVHLGRKELAAGLGLRLPRELEKEREMWHLLAAFVFYPYDQEWADQLDEFRTAAPGGDAKDAEDAKPA
jgi:hypothetical protein